MSNENSSSKMSKNMKAAANNKNEAFYVKKRGLFRKAEAVTKYCNADVFIIVHQKDSDKIFSFSSDPDFTLEKISALVLRDMSQGSFLKKNKIYEGTDFEQVGRNIKQIQKLGKAYLQRNEPLPTTTIQHENDQYLLQGRNGIEPTERTETEGDMSMQQYESYPIDKSSRQENSHPSALFSPKSMPRKPPQLGKVLSD